MGRRIELPKLPAGQPQEQLQALYSYLYRMAEALNGNLAEIGGNDLTDQERAVVREIIGTGDAEEGRSEAETLKSLIIKTAQFVKSELDEYRINLLGEYVADGKFGKYVRRTGLAVDVTPTGIQQTYTFQEIIQGLKTYEVNAKNYIKTGLLRTVDNVPVYGVAIGKDIVTFSEDGTETYNDGNKVAELTADELSFWQGGNKVASYTGTAITLYSGTSKRMTIDSSGVTFYNGTTKLAELMASALKFYYNGTLRAQYDGDGVGLYNGSTMLAKFAGDRIGFYQNGTEVFYISSGKMYCNSDMEISSGNSMKILSGGKLDVDSTNFKVDSFDGWICSYTTDNNFNGSQSFGLIPEAKKASVHMDIRQFGHQWGTSFRTLPMVIKCTDKQIEPGKSYVTQMVIGTLGKYSNGDFDKIPGIRVTGDIQEGNSNTDGVYFGIAGELLVRDYIGCDHDIKASGDVTAQAFINTSSREIKHNIRPMESKGEKLDRLRPVTFVYDNDPEEKTRHGLIYEDTLPVMPEICTGDESSKAINYVELVPMLLKEIQDLRARVKALEERGGN